MNARSDSSRLNLMQRKRYSMSNKENEKFNEQLRSAEETRRFVREDPLGDTRQLISQEVPAGVDRRDFLIRSAVVGAAAIMTGNIVSASERVEKAVGSIPP